MSSKENWDAVDRVFIEELGCRWGTKLDSGLDVLQWLEVADEWHAEELCYDRWTQLVAQWDEEVNAVIESGLPSSWHLFTRALFLPFPEKAQVLEVYKMRFHVDGGGSRPGPTPAKDGVEATQYENLEEHKRDEGQSDHISAAFQNPPPPAQNPPNPRTNEGATPNAPAQ
ncbi:hypothetical protein AAVH_06502 [Aphelenchoides avenae]|nr:hypothetical protein AAVH_06502 [Aphelenchus avenae]